MGNLRKEEWRPVIGFEAEYLISDQGRVWSVRNHRILKNKCVHGYQYVSLSVAGFRQERRIHRLVAEAFIPNPDGKPTVNHINENKSDNCVENLEWAAALEQNTHGTRIARAMANTDWKARTANMDYAAIAKKHNYFQMNKAQMKPVLQFDMHGTFIARHDGIAVAARTVKRKPCDICECVKGRRKSSAGYRWEYEQADDINVVI